MSEKDMVRASPENDPFDVEPERAGFELMVQSNGFQFWWASDLMRLLEYEGQPSFQKAVTRAMIVCHSLNIDQCDNFVQERREVDGKVVADFKLSRFACYLVAMNGDPKKPQVAQAQAYFVAWADACRLYLEQADGVERVAIRAEISEHERTLSGTAKMAGVIDYAFFQNAGYRGLYNMDLWKIRRRKGVPDGRSPLDFMGKTELAANLFRVTQTEEKIRAVLPDIEQAGLLGVLPNTPLLSVERIAYTYDDKAMELRRGLYRTDKHYYRNELS